MNMPETFYDVNGPGSLATCQKMSLVVDIGNDYGDYQMDLSSVLWTRGTSRLRFNDGISWKSQSAYGPPPDYAAYCTV